MMSHGSSLYRSAVIVIYAGANDISEQLTVNSAQAGISLRQAQGDGSTSSP